MLQSHIGPHPLAVASARPSRPWLSGIVLPLSTPMTADGAIDERGLERLVSHVLSGGVDGLFVLGSTGEAVYLDYSARRAIIERVLAVNAGHVPVVVGCIAPATWPVIAMAREAEALGADGVVVTPPFYGRTHPVEIAHHYRLVASAIDVPVVAYDVPVSTNSKLPSALVAELAADGVIAGLKDSSGDDAALRLTRAATAESSLAVLTGSELTVDAALLMGLDGAVPGLANVDPDGYVRLWIAGEQGRWDDVKREQDRLARLAEIIHVGAPDRMGRGSAGMSAFKSALMLRGVINEPAVAPPLQSLDAREVEQVRAILEETGLL